MTSQRQADADRLIESARGAAQAALDCVRLPEHEYATWSPLKRSEFARNIASVASVLQQAEGLEMSRERHRVQTEQLAIQRKAFGPLDPMFQLVEEIAEAADGKWDAAKVNAWVRRAAKLVGQ